MSEAMGKSMTSAGGTLTKGLTVPLTAVGAAAVASWKSVDEGLDTIVQKTGASGEALDSMSEIMKNLTTTIPTDFATAGAAIGEVNTRFGLTGQALEDLSARFIKFADLNGTDVSNSIDSVQAAMAAFGLEAEDAGDVLDMLNKAGQDTGVPMDKLAQSLLTNGTALQEMGYDINTSIGFLANLEKSGVDSSAVMTGLKKALQNATKDGKSMGDALADLQEQMAGAGSDTEAAQAAMELFGAKAGPAIAAAVQDGRLSFDDFSNSVEDWGDSVGTTFEGAQDPMDKMTTTMNELKLLGADLVEAAGPLITDVLGGLTSGVQALSEGWNSLSPEMQDVIIKCAGIAVVAGPLLSVGGKAVSGISAITGGLGSLAGKLGDTASAATSAAAPVEAAGGSFTNMAGGALQMIAAAAALYIAAQAMAVLADAAIEVSSAGTPAIATLAGMAIGVGALMAVASAVGPGLTAGAVGIGVFGAALLAIGGGVDLACTGIAKVTDSVGGLIDTISENAPEINSIVTNVGETVDGTVTTISDGITQVIDAISGGVEGVLGSVAGIFDSMGTAALNAGTGFEKLAGAVINLTTGTSVLDLGATLGATAKGVGDINSAASGAGTATTQIRSLTGSFTDLNKSAQNSTRQVVLFGTNFARAMSNANTAIRGAGLADSMQAVMNDVYDRADSAIDRIEGRFRNTNFDFEQHIRVPHFSMSGSFNAETGGTPSVSTSWYDKATSVPYLFRHPTIFGAGEAHDEIMYGRENLLRDIREASGGGTTVYVTVNGAENPEDWAVRFAKEFKLQARTA
jgi:phage-related minor tail protein